MVALPQDALAEGPCIRAALIQQAGGGPHYLAQKGPGKMHVVTL